MGLEEGNEDGGLDKVGGEQDKGGEERCGGQDKTETEVQHDVVSHFRALVDDWKIMHQMMAKFCLNRRTLHEEQ